ASAPRFGDGIIQHSANLWWCNATEWNGREVPRMFGPVVQLALIAASALPIPGGNPPKAGEEPVARLAEEVRTQGWIVFSARSRDADWDLFACRPDGSAVRNITRTPEFNEASPQFSHDGRRLLYRRLPRGETISGNQYGTQGELVFAHADGTSPRVFGATGE